MFTDINKKQLGIYIHIPFCISKCVYCDFLSGPADDCVKERYIDALLQEIRKTVRQIKDIDMYLVETVFFGGGTPSCIDAKLIKNIMFELRENFNFADSCEITIECNPGTLTDQKAAIYKECGINRISFGLQSADNKELKMLGRIHTFEQFKESLAIARKNGFNNINVDVMSALPGQTVAAYNSTLKKVIECDVEHISAYSLIIEEGTRLYDRLESDYPKLPDEDDERQMYYDTEKYLLDAGFEHYEISNYAKNNYECRHNISYWERKDYLGFGVGAASLFEEKRHTNITDIEKYIDILTSVSEKDMNLIWGEVSELSVNEQMEEFMFLGLRKIKGIDINEFTYIFNRKIEDVYGKVIKDNIKNGLLKIEDNRLMLTDRGIDISNVVMSEFLLDE